MIAVVVVALSFVMPMVIGLMSGEEVIEHPEVEGWNHLDRSDEVPFAATVEATTGNALEWDGSDESYVEADTGENLTDGSWTTCTVASLDSNANQQASHDALAFQSSDILLQHEDGNWSAFFYRDGLSAKATTVASSPTDKTPVCARWDEDAGELAIVESGTVQDTDTLDSNTVDRQVSVEWYGTLDEIRVWNESVSNADLQDYATEPTDPVSGTNHSLRMMFDEGSGSQTTAYYSSGDGEIVGGVSWTSAGVEGPDLDEGTDYEFQADPFQVRTLSGGFLDGAPIMYVSWGASGFGSLVYRLIGVGSSALGVLIIGLLVAAGSAVMNEFGGTGW